MPAPRKQRIPMRGNFVDIFRQTPILTAYGRNTGPVGSQATPFFLPRDRLSSRARRAAWPGPSNGTFCRSSLRRPAMQRDEQQGLRASVSDHPLNELAAKKRWAGSVSELASQHRSERPSSLRPRGRWAKACSETEDFAPNLATG